jgi:large subunit ribosomal protein MRP49
MIVNRKDYQEGTAMMTIYLLKEGHKPSGEPVVRIQPSSSTTNQSKAQPPSEDESVVKIDMKNKHSDEILSAFLAEIKAEPVQPSSEEVAEMKALEALRRKATADRAREQKARAAMKKEQAMLQQARQEVADAAA